MRVLFVFLNFDCPVGLSHGLAVLARELREAGHEVDLLHVSEVLSQPYDPEAIVARARAWRPDVVGLSFGTNHAWAAKVLARRLEDALPETFLVCGGIHPTIQPEEVAQWPGVDAVAVGEVDDGRFVALVEDLEAGSLDLARPGFWIRRGETLVRNPMAPPVDLEARPHRMDLTLFDHPRIIQAKRGYADAISGRGCPFSCTYCHNEPTRRLLRRTWGAFPTVRKRPVAEVITELEEYHARYGEHVRVFSFTDDVFPGPPEWTRRFLEAYEARFHGPSGPEVPLVFCAAPSQITQDLARWSKAAGVYMVRMGVESGSERVRRQVLGRPFSDQRILDAVRTLHGQGVNVLAFFMLALPDETARDVHATFEFAARLRPDALQFSVFWPYPGTSLHDRVVQQGLFDPADQYRGNYLSESPLEWSPPIRRRYARFRRLTMPAVNAHLLPGRGFQEIVDLGLAMSDEEWTSGGDADLLGRAEALALEALSDGEFVYVAPFEDRPDVLLLAGRHRTRPLINLPARYRC